MIKIENLKDIKFDSYPQPLSHACEFNVKCLYNGIVHSYSKKLYTEEFYKNDQELKDMLLNGLLEQLNRESKY